MKKRIKILIGILLGLGIVALTGWYLHGHLISVLQPSGPIGAKERNLIIFCALISIVVVVPVFVLLGWFAWHYREDNEKAKYTPEAHGSMMAETIWWLVPTLLIGIIAVITWRSSYALDPFKPLSSNKPTLHVQVVAMDWKWLFIYPDQHVASVNEAAIPVDQPVDFELTSDTAMSSFWAPQLGGQMYAMPGMSTQLNLQASKIGDYRGVDANISGRGFGGMVFTVKAMPTQDFNNWVASAKHAKVGLTTTTFDQLTKPSEDNKPAYYNSVTPGLYDTIVMKFMMPLSEKEATL